MYKRLAMVAFAALLAVNIGAAQTEDIFVEGFEVNDIELQGGSVTYSTVDEVAFENVPAIEGDWALYVEYESTSSNSWSQAALNLPETIDLTGISELRYSVYFLDDSTTNDNGQVPVRSHLPPDDGLSMDYVTPGEWYEIVMPIDPYISANDMPEFNLFRLVISAGLEGTGRFYIDNIYAVRPVNPVELEIVSVYGLNETNPGETTPLGFQQDQASLPPEMGANYVTPSEGDNCMLIPITANWVQSVRTIDTKNDVDWTRVRAIYFDVCVTEDFSTWGTIRPYLTSTSGGAVNAADYRGISDWKGEWRTVSFWLDLGPHMSSILDDGDFAIGFMHDNGSEASTPDGQHMLVDNIRFGLVPSLALAVRAFEDGVALYEGEAATVNVSVEVTMKGEAGAVTLTETLPLGWTASDISDGGVEADGVIAWELEVTPDTPVTVTYTVTSADAIATAPEWSGTVNDEVTFGLSSPQYFPQSVTDSMVDAPFIAQDVTLDGIISEGEYDGSNGYFCEHDVNDADGNTAPGVHISGVSYSDNEENLWFYVFHNQDYLYVGVDVTDPSLSFDYADSSFWNADSVEVYFDGNMSRSSSIESNRYGCQLTVVGDGRIAASNNTYFPEMLDAVGGGKYMENGRDGEDQPVYWACGAKVKDDESGFVIEYRINKDVILDPADRTQIGFELMVNGSDAENPEVRTGKWGWHTTDANGNVVEAYNNESAWTLLNLLDGGTPVLEWSLF